MGKGLESFVYREIEYLINVGFDITLFATKFKDSDIYGPKESWPYHRLQLNLNLIFAFVELVRSIFCTPRVWFTALQKSSLVDLMVAIYYVPLMRAAGITNIHCHFGDHKLFIGYFCSKLLNLPLSVTIHSHELHVNPNEKMFVHALAACERIFVISEFGKGILIDRFGVSEKKIILSYLCVDTEFFAPAQNLRVLSVARFEPQKGLNFLVEAAEILKDEPVEFVVVGWGPEPIEELIASKGLTRKFTVFPKFGQNQLRFVFQSCDVFCLPSIAHKEQGMEGIPVVLMESMATGLPVVATNPGAVREIVDEILIPAEDPVALAGAIRKFLESSELRVSQSRSNRSKVEEKFSLRNLEKFGQALASI